MGHRTQKAYDRLTELFQELGDSRMDVDTTRELTRNFRDFWGA